MNFTKTTFFTFCLVFLVAFCGHYKFQVNNILTQENTIQKEIPLVEPEYVNTATIPVMGTANIDVPIDIDVPLDVPLDIDVPLDVPIDIPNDLSAPTKENQTIVIDPGHGGYDPGKVGTGKNYEKDINLKIALKLKTFLEEHKYKTVLTRSEDKDLDSFPDKFHKREDMQNRVNIINESNATVLISIHQNAFAQPTAKGAQVFYYSDQSPGKTLATYVTESIHAIADPENTRLIKSSMDYFILKSSNIPGIIVECGFLTNREEEQKLLSDQYQSIMAQAIGTGIINFLENISMQATNESSNESSLSLG
ncbi:MAG: hypothetical protein ATN31_10450 [Candidatus Epulonipiscioides saccharophilum]|nr:MAG: hypothetical protein ATN31_10450 [Epulopiscium sp. AS2M-Bin001]